MCEKSKYSCTHIEEIWSHSCLYAPRLSINKRTMLLSSSVGTCSSTTHRQYCTETEQKRKGLDEKWAKPYNYMVSSESINYLIHVFGLLIHACIHSHWLIRIIVRKFWKNRVSSLRLFSVNTPWFFYHQYNY